MTGNAMIIDDDAVWAETVASVLRDLGLCVRTAQEGDEGLRLFRSGRYSLVVLDVNLPGMTGLEVLSQIREHDPILPVIVISGEDPNELQGAARSAGASALLHKPVRLGALRNTVSRFLPFVSNLEVKCKTRNAIATRAGLSRQLSVSVSEVVENSMVSTELVTNKVG